MLVARFIVGDNTGIFCIGFRLTGGFQLDPVFDPIAKVINIFQGMSRFDIQISDTKIGGCPLFEGIYRTKINLPEAAALSAPDQLPESALMIEVLVVECIL